MIGAAGDFLVAALEPVAIKMLRERVIWGTVLALPVVGALYALARWSRK